MLGIQHGHLSLIKGERKKASSSLGALMPSLSLPIPLSPPIAYFHKTCGDLSL